VIHLRPIRPEDEPFLQRVYASSREEELKQVDWDEQQKDHFLRMQFEAQHSHYTEHFPDADFQLVLKGDEAIGRLYVDRRSDEIRIIDIALLPGFQGEGTGSGLLEALLDEARQMDLPLRIHVEKFNPALRWYERLGFRQIEDKGMYLFMEWTPISGHVPG
jgi:GNAT superfamily N-acetyltransferase